MFNGDIEFLGKHLRSFGGYLQGPHVAITPMRKYSGSDSAREAVILTVGEQGTFPRMFDGTNHYYNILGKKERGR
ncbi:hypothetical protein XYCOK13_12470 [Xylanibacillus composti]|uniref:Uncharacterized protein n=1 Tax=Xylanibacillus composti TaxID=1572762 RepID=A0A8J4H498_9BACL|nr:hypothetical protein XYCOK13_12470 [Xylanibacillus composti]